MKLKKIHIEKFRGAIKPLSLPLDASKNITMIFAENGNGKSTISDALICCLSDKKEMGSLDDKSIPHAEKRKSLLALNAENHELKIVIETDANTFTTSFDGQSFSTTNADSKPKIAHLRRSQISKLLEAKPAERYDEVSDFIDVDNLLKCEVALAQTIKTEEIILVTVIEMITNSKELIEKNWTDAGKPGNKWEDWLIPIIKKDIGIIEARKKLLDDVLSKWKYTIDTKEEITTKIATIDTSQIELEEVNEEILKIGSAANQTKLLAVLKSAKGFIMPIDNIDKCPVCANDIEKEDLIKSLSIRIEEMNNLSLLLSRQTAIQKEIDRLNNNALNDLRQVIDRLKPMSEKLKLSESSISSFIDDLVLKFEEEEQLNNKFRIVYSEGIDVIKPQVNILKAEFGEINSEFEQYEILKNSYENLIEKTAEADAKNELITRLKRAYAIVSEERKAFIDEELDSITEEVNRMYAVIHPNEEIGNLKLFLKKSARKSLEVKSKFYGREDISPQALYSESHLDTLGVCIMLALAKKGSDGNMILVLDDVLTSVDHPHLNRFVNLIHDEAAHFGHIFITTHYLPWKEMYRHGRADKSDMEFFELKKWDIDNGISYQNVKTLSQELEYLLNLEYTDRQAISSKCGVIIEMYLKYLAKKYQCKLPLRDPAEYTMGEYVDCFKSTLKKQLISSVQQSDGEPNTCNIGELITKLKQYITTRNMIGAHFNTMAEHIGDADIAELVALTKKLYRSLECPKTHNLPNRRTGSYWMTKNETVKLEPLLHP